MTHSRAGTLTFLGLLTALAVLLATCGRENVNPPTEPAEPITGPAAEPPKETEAGSRPGTGAASFVGRWAANTAWCANTSGAERAIEITPTRFEGYENSCMIVSVDERPGGWTASLRCDSEGQTRHERVQVAVTDNILDLTYPDRGGSTVKLTRCPAPETAPAL